MKKLITIFSILGCAALAGASPITMSFCDIDGTEVDLEITIDEVQRNGESYIAITTNVAGDYYGDIVATYIDFSDPFPKDLTADDFLVEKFDNNISQLLVDENPDVTIKENGVSQFDKDVKANYANMNGEIGVLFDAGVLVGDNGLGKTDIDPATVFIRSGNSSISVSSIEYVGVRLMSVGISANVRNGSSKLLYDVSNVPEPATLTLFGAGLMVLAFFRKRKIS